MHGCIRRYDGQYFLVACLVLVLSSFGHNPQLSLLFSQVRDLNHPEEYDAYRQEVTCSKENNPYYSTIAQKEV